MIVILLKFSFIPIVISIVVQTIYGSANASATMQQANNESNQPIIFSDSGINFPMAQNQSKQISRNNNTSGSEQTSISANVSKPAPHSRGIHPTNFEDNSNTTKSYSNNTANKDQNQTASKLGKNELVNATASIPETKTTSTISKPTTTTTTAKMPKTTTTAIPKKPTVTYSVEDIPGVLESIQAKKQAQMEKEAPVAMQSSETISYQEQNSSHNFLMPIIGMIVVVPFVVVVTNCAVRYVRDYWSKRRYRRMDYLIEDMYN